MIWCGWTTSGNHFSSIRSAYGEEEEEQQEEQEEEVEVVGVRAAKVVVVVVVVVVIDKVEAAEASLESDAGHTPVPGEDELDQRAWLVGAPAHVDVADLVANPELDCARAREKPWQQARWRWFEAAGAAYRAAGSSSTRGRCIPTCRPPSSRPWRPACSSMPALRVAARRPAFGRPRRSGPAATPRRQTARRTPSAVTETRGPNA